MSTFFHTKIITPNQESFYMMNDASVLSICHEIAKNERQFIIYLFDWYIIIFYKIHHDVIKGS